MKSLSTELILISFISFFAFISAFYLSSNTNIFQYGVASGDPSQTSVVLWTRVSSAPKKEVVLRWEMALDSTFVKKVTNGKISATKTTDFCVKVTAQHLKPGTIYYYRFSYKNQYSPIGRTKTLPNSADTIRIAFVNCGEFQGGFFNGYGALSKFNDIDAVIHLGDYIYENGLATPGSAYYKAFLATGRKHDPPHELLTLEDYRTRYQQHRSEPELQQLHQRFPMINILDDHEVANDFWLEGSNNHQEADGDWRTRKKNALQAYFEWIPTAKKQGELFYRAFPFSDLVHLILLDTRLCCRSKQAVSKDQLQKQDTTAHIIGQQQLQWVKDEITQHKSIWNVFANPVLLSEEKPRNFNFDVWVGYPRERLQMLEFLEQHINRNFLFATGNYHNAEHFVLLDSKSQDTLAHELLTGSITSANYDERNFDNAEKLEQLRQQFTETMPNLKWFDLTNHGFLVVEFTKNYAKADWYFVSTILDKKYELIKAHTLLIPAK